MHLARDFDLASIRTKAIMIVMIGCITPRSLLMIHRMPWLIPQTVTTSVPAGFVPCPAALSANWPNGECPWKAIYEEAMARTRFALRPSKLERLNACLSN
jgi:hypothetical protein